MFRQLALIAALGALLLSTSAMPASAQEDDTTRARAEFTRGVELFQGSDFQRALDAFQEAYRLAPHASVRLNIANCYEQLGRPVEALFHFEHYLAEADHPAAAQRREIEASIRRLRDLVGTITLHVTPDGATITIDATDQRRSPVTDPVRVPAGRHTIEIRLDGYRTETQTVEVVGGADARVSLRLARQDAVATTTTTTPPVTTTETTPTTTTTTMTTTPVAATTTDETTTTTTTTTTHPDVLAEMSSDEEDDVSGLRIGVPTIIAGSVTIAALLVTVITGPLALSANAAFERDVLDANDPAVAPDVQADARADGVGHASEARTLATVTDVMLVTTIVAAGCTTALFIIDQLNAETETDEAEVAVLPVFTPQAIAITAYGRF